MTRWPKTWPRWATSRGRDQILCSHTNICIQRFPLVGIDYDTTRHYARVDTWIAAQALSINATLVSDNERELSRVPGLLVENWLTGGSAQSAG